MIVQTQNDQALVKEIKELVKYMRYFSSLDNLITKKEENDLKMLPKEQQKSARLNLTEQKKKQKIKQCLEQIKEKLAAAGVSAQTVQEVERAIRKIEDNGYNCSAQTAHAIGEIQGKTEPTKKPEKDVLSQKSIDELNKMLGRAVVAMLISVLKAMIFGIKLAARRRPRRQRRQHHR